MTVTHFEAVGLSLSSALTSAISLYANSCDADKEVRFSLINRACAAVAFPLIAVIAIVETVAMGILFLFSTILLAFDYKDVTRDLALRTVLSSVAILWSVSNFFINFNVCNFTGFVHKPIDVLDILKTGSLMFTIEPPKLELIG